MLLGSVLQRNSRLVSAPAVRLWKRPLSRKKTALAHREAEERNEEEEPARGQHALAALQHRGEANHT